MAMAYQDYQDLLFVIGDNLGGDAPAGIHESAQRA